MLITYICVSFFLESFGACIAAIISLYYSFPFSLMWFIVAIVFSSLNILIAGYVFICFCYICIVPFPQ